MVAAANQKPSPALCKNEIGPCNLISAEQMKDLQTEKQGEDASPEVINSPTE